MDGNTTDFAAYCKSSKYYSTGCIMMLIFLILCFIFCLIALYFLCCCNNSNNLHTNQSSINTSRRPKGLSPLVLKSLSSFVYSSLAGAAHGPTEVVECAVCLAEFEEKDLCRMLPKCCHVFHVECIDTWFVSHSECPLCRTTVQALETNRKTQTGGSVPQIAIDI